MPLRWPRALLDACTRTSRASCAGSAPSSPSGTTPRAREEGTAAQRGRLRYWLPFAIVAVSVGAAAMGWQASIADERATHHDVVSRQDLVRLSQIKLQKLQGVDAELRTYGDYERSWLLALEQARDAGAVTGPERQRLSADARANLGAGAVGLQASCVWRAISPAPGARTTCRPRSFRLRAGTPTSRASSRTPCASRPVTSATAACT